MRRALGLFVIYKALVLGLAFVSMTVVAKTWPSSLGHFISLFFQWDANYLVRVASEGWVPAAPSSFNEPRIQVFPVVPLVARLFHVVIPDWKLAIFASIQFWSFAAFYYLYQLARERLKDRYVAETALALFALFPMAYFLTAPYMEAAYCAVSFAAAYYIQRRNYPAATVTVALMVLTRITGLFVVPAIAVHAFVNRKELKRRDVVGLSAAGAAGIAGYLIYLGMNRYLYGDWFYYLGSQQKNWGVHASTPFSGGWDAIKAFSSRPPDQRTTISLLEVLIPAVAVAAWGWIVWRAWRRRELKTWAFDATYMGVSLAAILSLNFWISQPRYMLPLYPMFLIAAPWFADGGKSPFRLAFYALGSVGLFAIYWATFLNAQWAY